MTADVGTSSQPRNSKEEGGSVLDISLGEVRKGETSSLTGEGSTNNATADDSFAVQDQTLVDGVNSNVSGSQQSPSRAEHQQHTKSPSSSSVLSSSKVKEKEVMPTAATNAYSGAWDITSWNPSGKSKTGDTSFSTNHDTTLVAGSGADQTVDIALATLRKEGDEAGARKAENSDFLKPSDGGEVEGGSGANLAPKPSPTPSRRPSALQLKPPSPQPWDLVEPPEGPMKGRSVNELSPADISQKFGVTPYVVFSTKLDVTLTFSPLLYCRLF
ncbi:hypothetical protein CC1G_08636 [Coprinopsis cinerea okayama7|uniref:Uncharacterized protein n=1 Tax=Coprinopsis cinerea (strain Okayama-7 / 130 / ATCC MYA-4618 / FGSC 9003) TaxID=240176 RepID=A8N0T9_COPC7|nr:hypothetical protein CC1G_08636 [Coprinopsis cinerea okayama7\|eukprot:XP_001828490.2 hypothetical protein CC1G_08636 [Coprinopsis cinerea okayama7\